MKKIELMIYVMNHTTNDGKRRFKTFRTAMMLPVKQEDGTLSEPVKKYLNVKFRKEVDVNKLTRGIITCTLENVQAPRTYDVKINANGEKQYPCVWVNKIEDFKPIMRTKDIPAFIIDNEFEDDEL